jgi:acyl-CoA synthetase (NDP forming)/GNAT superfamily N-acetyltransferase
MGRPSEQDAAVARAVPADAGTARPAAADAATRAVHPPPTTVDLAAPDTEAGVDALTADGGIVHIRPVRTGDLVPLKELHERASAQSRYLRFFSAGAPAEPEAARLTRPADENHAVLVAEDGDFLVGTASYERLDDGRAEFAVFVDDRCHGRGIGTLLMERLAAVARRHGVSELVGDVLTTNTPMLKVSFGLVPGAETSRDIGVVRVHLPTEPTEAALAAADARDRTAAHHSLRPLLAPASVAVIGAGRKPGGVGHEVLQALRDSGYAGAIFPINPNADEVCGLTARPDLAAVGQPVDLAVIAVPAALVPAAVADCGRHGVRAVVVLSAGFSETGPAGAAAQAGLVRTARANGMRLVGPNCLGVLNTDPDVRLAATFAATLPPAGALSVASQSGAVGIAILDHAARTGTGIASFVSLGNKADVSGNDLLAYWYDDPATRAVALYLESFGNPRRFARVARALARRKPVLAVKSGRSAGGRRAGASHTAAAAAPDIAVDSLFAQAGVARTDTLGELLDAARMLTDQPLPLGSRVVIVGNAGGANVLAADAAEAAGLVVPELSAALQVTLTRLAPNAAGYSNPIDLGASMPTGALGAAVAALAGSDEVDAIVAILAGTRTNDVPGALAALTGATDEVNLPVAAVLLGLPAPPAQLGRRRVPVYGLPEQAVHALGHAARYAAWRSEPLGSRPQLTGINTARARGLLTAALGAGGGWQPPEWTNELLACYGITAVPTIAANSTQAAVQAAQRIGYPVVLKAGDPDLVHKSDVGGVRLNLADEAAVRAAYAAVASSLGQPAPRVVVQPMVAGTVELVAGVVHDALFGSLVMLGLGGVLTDLLADRTFRLLPVTDLDAGRMWRSLRSSRLLTGYRGSAAVDVDALEQVLLRLGRLAEELPEVAELDLNPLLARPDGISVVDAKLRVAPIGAEPDSYSRVLRTPS